MKPYIYPEKNFYVSAYSSFKILSEAAINAQGRRSRLLRYIQSPVNRKRFDGSDADAREGSCREGSEWLQRSLLRAEAEQRDEIQEQYKEEDAESLLGRKFHHGLAEDWRSFRYRNYTHLLCTEISSRNKGVNFLNLIL